MFKSPLALAAAVSIAAALAPCLSTAAPRHAAARPPAGATRAAPLADGAGTSTGDVRCLLISRLVLQSSDSARQAMGAAGSLYFSARLQGRMTDRQIEAALVADAQKSRPSPDQTKGCGDRLDARMKELDAISQRVDARLDAISPPRAAASATLPAAPATTAGADPQPDPQASPPPPSVVVPQDPKG